MCCHGTPSKYVHISCSILSNEPSKCVAKQILCVGCSILSNESSTCLAPQQEANMYASVLFCQMTRAHVLPQNNKQMCASVVPFCQMNRTQHVFCFHCIAINIRLLLLPPSRSSTEYHVSFNENFLNSMFRSFLLLL